MTFCVELLGVLVTALITLPSIVVPGSGILLAAVQIDCLGAVVRAPTLGSLALGMIPHSGTLLLEGEGYILATIFALLIPIRIAQGSLGGSPVTRFGRAILLNIQASFWGGPGPRCGRLVRSRRGYRDDEVSQVPRLNRKPENSDGEITS